MGSDRVEHLAELIAYAVLLFTLAILPLAFALHDPMKNPLFVGPASLASHSCGSSHDFLDQDNRIDFEEGYLEHMKDGETRTLRVDIPSDLANLLDQVKIISGKSKRDTVIQALRLLFDSDPEGIKRE